MSRLPTFEPGEYHAGVTLDYVTPRVSIALSRMLRPHELWKEWAGVLKDPLGEYMYLMQDIWLLELEKDPVEVIWRHLGKYGRDLGYVRDTLIQATLMRPAQFIAVNVLHESFSVEVSEVDTTNAFTDKGAVISKLGGKDQIHGLQADLQSHYCREFQHVNPVPWNEHFVVELQQLYTQVKVIPVQKGQRGTVEASLASRNDQDRKSIGQILEGSVRAGLSGRGLRILVEGEAGTGKSTLLQKISLDWNSTDGGSEKTETFPVPFDLVLMLQGHSIGTPDIKDVLTSELLACLGNDYRGILDDPEVQKKTLILVDAADEIQNAKQKLLPLLSGQQFGKCTVLLTSRTNHMADLSRYFDDTYVLPGFPTSSVLEFIKKYANETGCSEEQLNVLSEQTGPDISALKRIPLLLLHLCMLVEDGHGDLPQSRTELYETITQIVVDKTAERLGISVEDCNTAFENLCAIGLAVNAKNKNDFQESELPESCRMTSLTQKFGFLNKRMSKSRLAPKEVFCFSHRTLHEFLTAKHLMKLTMEERKEILKDGRCDPNWTMVLVFLSGLLRGDDEELERFYKSLVCKNLNCSADHATSWLDGDTMHERYHLGLQCLAESGLFSSFRDLSPRIVPHAFATSSGACYYCVRGFEVATQINLPHKPEIMIADNCFEVFLSYRDIFQRLLSSSKCQQSFVASSFMFRALMNMLQEALPLFEKLENFYVYLSPMCFFTNTVTEDEMPSGLEKLRNLKSLVFQSTDSKMTPSSEAESTVTSLVERILGQLGQIETLILTSLRVPDSTIALIESGLHQWHRLQKLVLQNLEMEGASLLKILQLLEQRQNLTTLELFRCSQASSEEVRQAQIQSLANILLMNQLECFTLGDLDLKGDLTPLVKALAGCQSLKKLKFRGKMFTKEHKAKVLEILAQMKSLKELKLLAFGVSEVSFSFAQSLKQLIELQKLCIVCEDLGSCEEFMDMCTSVKNMHKLQTVTLDYCGLTDKNQEGLMELFQNTTVAALSMKGNAIGQTEAEIERVVLGLAQCRSIKQLVLSTEKMSESILKLIGISLAESHPNLSVLNIETSDIQGSIAAAPTSVKTLKGYFSKLEECSFGSYTKMRPYFLSTESVHGKWRQMCLGDEDKHW